MLFSTGENTEVTGKNVGIPVLRHPLPGKTKTKTNKSAFAVTGVVGVGTQRISIQKCRKVIIITRLAASANHAIMQTTRAAAG